MLVENTRFLGQRQRTHWNCSCQSINIFWARSPSLSSTGQREEDQPIPAHTAGYDTGEEFRKLKSFIMRSEHVCPLLWKKTPCQSFKAVNKSVLCSGGRLYLPRLFTIHHGKIVWNKEQLVPCNKSRNMRSPWQIVSQQWHRTSLPHCMSGPWTQREQNIPL